MSIRAFVFDAYGTLFDVHAAIARHRAAAGPDADRLSELWRTKQLEYTWTLTLMGRYEPFWRLTERALDFALARFPSVDPGLKPKLLEAYRELGAFPDARAALEALKAKGMPTAILSNGSPDMLAAAVTAAGLGKLLDHVLSVDAIRIYKPRREVYALAIDRARAVAGGDRFRVVEPLGRGRCGGGRHDGDLDQSRRRARGIRRIRSRRDAEESR